MNAVDSAPAAGAELGQVFLATGRNGRVPQRYRGRDISSG